MKRSIHSTLLCLCIAGQASIGSATEPKCEVADPIYRDGVGLGWGLFIAKAITGWLGSLTLEAWKAHYVEDGNDAWHAGLLWKYNEEFGTETFWVIHSMTNDADNPDETTGEGPQYGTFDGAFLKEPYKNARRHPSIRSSETARENIILAAVGQITSEVDYPGNWHLLWTDFVTKYKSPGESFRCDGLVEYAYETAGLDIVPPEVEMNGALLTPYFQAQAGYLLIAADGDWGESPSHSLEWSTAVNDNITIKFGEKMSGTSMLPYASKFVLKVNGATVSYTPDFRGSNSEPKVCYRPSQ